jgi:hypothetical protein
MIVVEMHVRREPSLSLGRTVVCEPIGPLASQRLHEPLGLGLKPVRSNALVARAERSALFSEPTRHERRPVVAHDPLDRHVLVREP